MTDGTDGLTDGAWTGARPPRRSAATAPVPALAEAIRTEVLRQVDERPYTSILVALAGGYVLAVGAPKWLTSLAWSLGSRAALARVAGMLSEG